MYGLIYDDPIKLEFISERGLHLYLQFPKQESLQQTRNYVLSALITLFLTIVATLLFNLCKDIYQRRCRLKKFITHLELHHYKQYLIYKKHILIIDALIASTIILGVIVFNPFDWSALSKCCVVGMVIGFVLSINHSYNVSLEEYPIVIKSNKRIKIGGVGLIFIAFTAFYIHEFIIGIINPIDFIAYIVIGLFGIMPLIIINNHLKKKKRK